MVITHPKYILIIRVAMIGNKVNIEILKNAITMSISSPFFYFALLEYHISLYYFGHI